MDTMNRRTVQVLDAEVRAALEPVAQKHGLTLSMRGGFSSHECRLTVTFELPAAVKEKAALLGLGEEVVGKLFKYGTRTYRVTGLNPRAPSYPIEAERVPDGKRFRFPAVVVETPKRPKRPLHKRQQAFE